MAFWEHFPYTNFHEINLEWFCKTAKENEKRSADAVKTAEDAKKYVENVDYSAAANEAVKKLYQNGDFETYANYRFFMGKKIVIIGDSNSDEGVTWGVMPNWVYYMRQKLDGVASEIVNNSKSGRRWCGSSEVSSVLEAIEESAVDISGADIVYLFAGINDYYNNTPLGMFNSGDISNFNGAVSSGLKRIKSLNPNTQIVVITPLAHGETYLTAPVAFYRMILAGRSKNHTLINGNCAPGYVYRPDGTDFPSIDGLHINPKYAPIFAEYILNTTPVGQSYKDDDFIISLSEYANSANVSECYLYATISSDGSVALEGTYKTTDSPEAYGTILTNLPEWFGSYTTLRLIQTGNGIEDLIVDGNIYTALRPSQQYVVVPVRFYSKSLHYERYP